MNCKITATKKQLLGLDIDFDIMEYEGELIKIFPDRWYEVRVKYKPNVYLGIRSYTFDIPEKYLSIKKDA